MESFRFSTIDGLLMHVGLGLRRIIEMADSEEMNGRRGGHFRLALLLPNVGLVEVLSGVVGELPVGKLLEKQGYSFEKMTRLAGNMVGPWDTWHVSSWQSADEAKKRFGGAIAAVIPAGQSPTGENCPAILSFSGLPPAADEALDVLVARNHGWLTVPMIQRIRRASDNHLITRLFGDVT